MVRPAINMVDAVATIVPRLARSRSAILRLGIVVAFDSVDDGIPWRMTNLLEVQVGDGTVLAGYHKDVSIGVGDQVSLINDGDIWLVLGAISTYEIMP